MRRTSGNEFYSVAGAFALREVLARFERGPAIIGVITLANFRYLAGKVLRRGNPYRYWLAGTLLVLADAIGQDYFSPQSVGFALGLGAYALACEPPDESRGHTVE